MESPLRSATDGMELVFSAPQNISRFFPLALSSPVAHSFGNVGRVGWKGGEGRKVQSTVSSRVRNIGGELGEGKWVLGGVGTCPQCRLCKCAFTKPITPFSRLSLVISVVPRFLSRGNEVCRRRYIILCGARGPCHALPCLWVLRCGCCCLWFG